MNESRAITGIHESAGDIDRAGHKHIDAIRILCLVDADDGFLLIISRELVIFFAGLESEGIAVLIEVIGRIDGAGARSAGHMSPDSFAFMELGQDLVFGHAFGDAKSLLSDEFAGLVAESVHDSGIEIDFLCALLSAVDISAFGQSVTFGVNGIAMNATAAC